MKLIFKNYFLFFNLKTVFKSKFKKNKVKRTLFLKFEKVYLLS